MRILICGDRNWADENAVKDIIKQFEPSAIIEGEAKGADTLARLCGEELGIEVLRFPADWKGLGKAAGPIRNSQMLKVGLPDIIIGFHNNIESSKGTRDMLSRAYASGKPTFLYANGELKEFKGLMK